jgi:hypothetical protein
MYTESLLFPHTHPRLVTKSRYTHEDTLKYVHLCFDYFEDLIDSNKIDCVIDVAHGRHLQECPGPGDRKAGIPYIYPFNALLGDSHGDRFRINTGPWNVSTSVRDRYEQLLVRKGTSRRAGTIFRDSGTASANPSTTFSSRPSRPRSAPPCSSA